MPCVEKSSGLASFWLAIEQMGEQWTFARKYKTKTRAKFAYRIKLGGNDRRKNVCSADVKQAEF